MHTCGDISISEILYHYRDMDIDNIAHPYTQYGAGPHCITTKVSP